MHSSLCRMKVITLHFHLQTFWPALTFGISWISKVFCTAGNFTIIESRVLLQAFTINVCILFPVHDHRLLSFCFSMNQALSPSSSQPPADDIITTTKPLHHVILPWVPATEIVSAGLPFPVFFPFWGSRKWWRWRQRGGGWDGRPWSKPIWWLTLFFTLFLAAGRKAAVSYMEAQTESAGAPTEPQYGPALCTQWSWKKHPGNQDSICENLCGLYNYSPQCIKPFQ